MRYLLFDQVRSRYLSWDLQEPWPQVIFSPTDSKVDTKLISLEYKDGVITLSAMQYPVLRNCQLSSSLATKQRRHCMTTMILGLQLEQYLTLNIQTMTGYSA